MEKQQLVQKTTRQFICHLEVAGVLINEILPEPGLTEHRSEDLKMLE